VTLVTLGALVFLADVGFNVPSPVVIDKMLAAIVRSEARKDPQILLSCRHQIIEPEPEHNKKKASIVEVI